MCGAKMRPYNIGAFARRLVYKMYLEFYKFMKRGIIEEREKIDNKYETINRINEGITQKIRSLH